MRSLPRLGEVLFYLRHRGVRRAAVKFVLNYLGGRQHWYVTIEDLRRWTGMPLPPTDLELRWARADDVARMDGFTARQHPRTLRAWCRPGHFFFIALKDGVPISYRCVATSVHRMVRSVVRLSAERLFVLDEFTVPAFRRRGITRQLAIAMNPELIRHGFSEVVGLHWTDNADTIAAARAKGIVTIGRLSVSRLAWKTWFRYEPFVTGVAVPLAGVEWIVYAESRHAAERA